MKVFVAGATGAIGRELVPRLVTQGHDVVAMTRSESKQQRCTNSALLPWSPTHSMLSRSPVLSPAQRPKSSSTN